MYVGVGLDRAPIGTALTLVEADIDAAPAHRLASFGLRVGSGFSVLSRTAGGGRVVLVAGSRVAVGRSLLAGLRAEVRA
ncbi:MAG: ferrous iron transport protein A [Propionibacteriaceae bacterium]|jgi:ferrous iron transport protein A|nr:ferrous iron transport protein A [Propionibacteriaceae bacterium]